MPKGIYQRSPELINQLREKFKKEQSDLAQKQLVLNLLFT